MLKAELHGGQNASKLHPWGYRTKFYGQIEQTQRRSFTYGKSFFKYNKVIRRRSNGRSGRNSKSGLLADAERKGAAPVSEVNSKATENRSPSIIARVEDGKGLLLHRTFLKLREREVQACGNGNRYAPSLLVAAMGREKRDCFIGNINPFESQKKKGRTPSRSICT